MFENQRQRTPDVASRPALGPTQNPIQCVPGVKQPGREADHSSPSRAKVKTDGVIPPFPHNVFNGIVLN
jgi:hypothetical protein